MTLLLIVLGSFLLVWWVARLAVTVRGDGYGLRPPPRSHPQERLREGWPLHPHG